MKKNFFLFKYLSLDWALKIFFLKIVGKLFRIPVFLSYLQSGEDIISHYLLPAVKGTYVDVGCNDPVNLSNTFKGFAIMNAYFSDNRIQVGFSSFKKSNTSV